MTKFALAAVLFLAGATAQAELVEIKCKPNSQATVSQFMVVANLAVDDDNSVMGTVQYATRSSATAQTSDVQTISVTGNLVVIPAGELATHEVESFQLIDETDRLVRLKLNPSLEGPNSSTMIINRKNRYSSQCKVVR